MENEFQHFYDVPPPRRISSAKGNGLQTPATNRNVKRKTKAPFTSIGQSKVKKNAFLYLKASGGSFVTETRLPARNQSTLSLWMTIKAGAI
jgi:hypothetical protein